MAANFFYILRSAIFEEGKKSTAVRIELVNIFEQQLEN